jgi:rhodanese-related sulfurtransferase
VLFGAARWRFAEGAIAIAGLALVAHVTIRRLRFPFPSERRRTFLAMSAAQCALLTGLTVVGASLYDDVSREGLLANPVGVSCIQQAHHADFLSEVSADEVRRLLGAPDVVLVDARYPWDFAKGHLPGAMGVSIKAGQEQVVKAMSRVPKDDRIIVYCQSRSCPFGGKVAGRLQAAGFQNIALFRGGWQEWTETMKGAK